MSYCDNDPQPSDPRTDNAGCMAIGCVVAMGGVLGFLLLVAWIVAPWLGEALA